MAVMVVMAAVARMAARPTGAIGAAVRPMAAPATAWNQADGLIDQVTTCTVSAGRTPRVGAAATGTTPAGAGDAAGGGLPEGCGISMPRPFTRTRWWSRPSPTPNLPTIRTTHRSRRTHRGR